MAVALPDAPLLGPEGVGETGFFDPKEGGLPADVASRVLITIPGVAPEQYPPAGKEFLKAYSAKYGEKNPDRYAVYGYESMSLLLDAIKRAGDNGSDREAVVDALMSTKDREGVFGTYSIDENGDITLTPYGIYKIADGAMVFDRGIEPDAVGHAGGMWWLPANRSVGSKRPLTSRRRCHTPGAKNPLASDGSSTKFG